MLLTADYMCSLCKRRVLLEVSTPEQALEACHNHMARLKAGQRDLDILYELRSRANDHTSWEDACPPNISCSGPRWGGAPPPPRWWCPPPQLALPKPPPPSPLKMMVLLTLSTLLIGLITMAVVAPRPLEDLLSALSVRLRFCDVETVELKRKLLAAIKEDPSLRNSEDVEGRFASILTVGRIQDARDGLLQLMRIDDTSLVRHAENSQLAILRMRDEFRNQNSQLLDYVLDHEAGHEQGPGGMDVDENGDLMPERVSDATGRGMVLGDFTTKINSALAAAAQAEGRHAPCAAGNEQPRGAWAGRELAQNDLCPACVITGCLLMHKWPHYDFIQPRHIRASTIPCAKPTIRIRTPSL